MHMHDKSNYYQLLLLVLVLEVEVSSRLAGFWKQSLSIIDEAASKNILDQAPSMIVTATSLQSVGGSLDEIDDDDDDDDDDDMTVPQPSVSSSFSCSTSQMEDG